MKWIWFKRLLVGSLTLVVLYFTVLIVAEFAKRKLNAPYVDFAAVESGIIDTLNHVRCYATRDPRYPALRAYSAISCVVLPK